MVCSATACPSNVFSSPMADRIANQDWPWCISVPWFVFSVVIHIANETWMAGLVDTPCATQSWQPCMHPRWQATDWWGGWVATCPTHYTHQTWWTLMCSQGKGTSCLVYFFVFVAVGALAVISPFRWRVMFSTSFCITVRFRLAASLLGAKCRTRWSPAKGFHRNDFLASRFFPLNIISATLKCRIVLGKREAAVQNNVLCLFVLHAFSSRRWRDKVGRRFANVRHRYQFRLLEGCAWKQKSESRFIQTARRNKTSKRVIRCEPFLSRDGAWRLLLGSFSFCMRGPMVVNVALHKADHDTKQVIPHHKENKNKPEQIQTKSENNQQNKIHKSVKKKPIQNQPETNDKIIQNKPNNK